MTLPNVLTGIRILLVGVFYYLFQIKHIPLAAFAVYVVASLTDILDGYLARKWNQITTFGKLMDPLADKLLLVVALYCFTINHYLPWFILIFVLIKEAIMIIAAAILYKRRVVVYSKLTGKMATVVFTIAVILAFALTVDRWNTSVLRTAVVVIFGIAIGLGIIAMIQYAHSFWRDCKKVNE